MSQFTAGMLWTAMLLFGEPHPIDTALKPRVFKNAYARAQSCQFREFSRECAVGMVVETVKTQSTLEKRIQSFYDRAKSGADEERLLNEMSKAIADAELHEVKKLAFRKGVARDYQWMLFVLMLERRQYDHGVAILLAYTKRPETKNISYSVWKLWELRNGEKKDYQQRSKQYLAAFLRAFKRGNKADRVAIARVFRLDKSAAKKSAEEFRVLIRLPKHRK